MVPVYYQLTAYNPSDFLLRGGSAVLDSIIMKLLKKSKGDGEGLLKFLGRFQIFDS